MNERFHCGSMGALVGSDVFARRGRGHENKSD